MELWDRLAARLGLKRGAGTRYFELEEALQTKLMDLAEQERRPPHSFYWYTSRRLSLVHIGRLLISYLPYSINHFPIPLFFLPKFPVVISEHLC